MATVTTPVLDLLMMDTHTKYHLAIGDISQYPSNYNIQVPTLEITPPGYPKISLAFVANSIQIYNSDTLGITCPDTACSPTPLPDGIYKVKYSIYPAYKYYVEKSFLRTTALLENFDKAYLKLDLLECDQQLKYHDRQLLDNIEHFINGAIAAGNNCANKLSMELYQKANTMLTKFIDNRCWID